MDYTYGFRRLAAAVDTAELVIAVKLIHKWQSPCSVNSTAGTDMSDMSCRNPSIVHIQRQDFQYLLTLFWDCPCGCGRGSGFVIQEFAKFVSWWWLSLVLETFRAWLRAAPPRRQSYPSCESQLRHSGSVSYGEKSLQRVARVLASGPTFKHLNLGKPCWH